MGMTDEDGRPPSAEFASLFRQNADAGGVMTFAGFMSLALYDPRVGYYRAERPRVGRGRGTDFFTSSTMGPIFGELVAAACADLLGDCDPGEFTFVEIGAEPPGKSRGGILEGAAHRFGAARALGIGDLFELNGRCVVFSNELFDAQPFHRFVFRGGAWRELGVRLDGESLVGVELPTPTPAPLPPCAAEGYVFDAPLGAAELLERVAVQPWTGLLVACDYGKSWNELAADAPFGTARAYHRHAQSNDLLARPGRQDLTCHVCWDWLASALERNGFEATRIDSQEAFFVGHAGDYISAAIAADAARFSRRKGALLELLHPVHLGQKFQVLHASRGIAAREAV
jgi:SAM-dependent MidA family methyltransferase